MNFPKNSSKQQKSIVYQYVAQFGGGGEVFVYISPFYWFDQKQLFKQIHFFPQDLPLFKLVKKNKLSEYICAIF